ncbi:MAG: murein L,D-transpeptidase [Xanthobacteraceae bacterium]|nr:MAG: murein L,D-transpeptidase [Xanthobacteraceae bacterium]
MNDFLTDRKRHDRYALGRTLAVALATWMTLAGVPALAQTSSPETVASTTPSAAPDTTAAPPVTEAKASESKPSEPTVSEAKPSEAKPPEAKPEQKAEDAKPAEPAVAAPAATPAPPAAAPVIAADPAKDAAKAVAAADQAVADKLRELIASKGLKQFDSKAERTAVEAFYAARNHAPLWSTAGKPTARALSAIARLKGAGADGLDAADYPMPDLATASSPEALAAAELQLTATVLEYARHAYSGRMHWSRVSADIAYPEHPVDPAEVLAKVADAPDAAAALDGYNPPHEGYKALKAKLAELRGQSETPAAPIAEGAVLKFSKKKPPAEDDRVPALRARLGVASADDRHYDAAVAEAVKKFQMNHDLAATGTLDNATVRAFNSPRKDRIIDIVRVNMERWRWLPRQLGEPRLGNAYVILNIPDFTLKVMQNGAPVWTTRVVTGKPGKTATPMLSETMKFITVNPTWNVPPSIVYNEYLPALRQDPTVLQRMGLRLSQNRDGSVHISQPPGAGNALGRIRFNFPNKFLVYQHDTPDKNLFAHETRAYSHGCMRVQNPDQYAATLLKITLPHEHYTVEKIRGMYGSSEININFPIPIPVNITYQTAFVNEAGKLEIRKDVYGRDARMFELLRGSERRSLEVAVSHAQPSYGRPSVSLPDGVVGNYSSGPSFLERLFGGGPAEPPPPPSRRSRRAQR